MPTLSAMFRLMDGYSTQINKFIGKVDSASTKVLEASKNTDSYNESLRGTGAAANTASSGLTRMIGAVATLATAKKTMDLTDAYTNTAARLRMVNDELQTQAELQDKVMEAANRARGSYADMASAVAKMNLLAGDSFKTNDEAIGFTELLQKSLKVSGAGTSEQQSAFLQLTQAMAAGKLQGDEFRSVMENAPMVADAIAKYLGVTKGELKELGAEGALTANVIKNALFAASDEINEKFNDMPPTFADTWDRIKNAGMDAFGGVFTKLNDLLNSDTGQQFTDNLVGAIYLAGDAMEGFIDFCVDAWPIVSPFIWAAAAALGAYATAQLIVNGLSLLSSLYFGAQAAGVGLYALALWATTGATWAEVTAQLGLNSALYACPLVWIIGIILVFIAVLYAGVAAYNKLSGASLSATGIMVGTMGVLAASINNKITFIWNLFADLANFICNCFNDVPSAVSILFYDMAITVLGYIESIASGIQRLINAIPGVEVNIMGNLTNLKSGLEKEVSEIKDAAGWTEYVKKREYKDLSAAYDDGYGKGVALADKASNLFAGFMPEEAGGVDYSQFASSGLDGIGTGGNPATVKGTGAGGAVKVENEEDIEWMRKLAERDYVARIAQNTLAPNIKVEFNGPITKEADTDGVMSRVVEQLKDAIASGPEGVPA